MRIQHGGQHVRLPQGVHVQHHRVREQFVRGQPEGNRLVQHVHGREDKFRRLHEGDERVVRNAEPVLPVLVELHAKLVQPAKRDVQQHDHALVLRPNVQVTTRETRRNIQRFVH